MKSHILVQLAALSGVVAVVMGAFGAHALRSAIDPVLMAAYQTGVQYHFYHTLSLLLLGLLSLRGGRSFYLGAGSVFFCLGIVLFSGSLYLLAITGMTRLGMITPMGGLSFICGWVCTWMYAFKELKEPLIKSKNET